MGGNEKRDSVIAKDDQGNIQPLTGEVQQQLAGLRKDLTTTISNLGREISEIPNEAFMDVPTEEEEDAEREEGSGASARNAFSSFQRSMKSLQQNIAAMERRHYRHSYARSVRQSHVGNLPDELSKGRTIKEENVPIDPGVSGRGDYQLIADPDDVIVDMGEASTQRKRVIGGFVFSP